jgi:hypothetical protein
LCALARGEGRLLNGPRDAGPPIGYVAAIRDPDGHTLEVSFGFCRNFYLRRFEVSSSSLSNRAL